MNRSHEKRAVGALLSFFSRSEPVSTDTWLQSGCCEARRLRSRAVGVFILQRIDRFARARTLVCITASVPGRGCSAQFLLH